MICIAGKNDIAANVLRFVVGQFGVDYVVAIANRDDTGRATWQHSLRATAQLLNVRLITLDEAYEFEGLAFFSVEFDRIVIPAKFRRAQLYNIHFSLLPKYKGVYTAVWPLLNGEAETGVTLHRMEAGIDTGPIIYQAILPIGLAHTARDVYFGCLTLGYEVLREHIPRLVAHPDPGVPQAALHSTYYGSKSIDYANLAFNLRQTAFQVHNAVRAFTFQEYQMPVLLGRRVCASYITTRASTQKPGEIVSENESEFTVSTIDFDLKLTKDFTYALWQAIDAGKSVEVGALAAKVPSLEFTNKHGWTPLMVAAFGGSVECVKALVRAGANPNAATRKGTSVLMYAKTEAASTNDLRTLEYLLDSGANAAAADITGTTVLEYAAREGNLAVLHALRKRL